MPKPRKGNPLDGIVLIDKPLGLSSNIALQKTKRIFQAQKAGHTGSLDPLATGVLPICFGEATKVSAFLLSSDKRYTTTAQLGVTRTTGDLEGEVVETRDVPELNEAYIESILDKFRGDIEQTPPMYSALKHEGVPLYKLARQGITIDRKVRQVTIYEINLLGFTENTLTLDVRCSKGTYIRTLLEDIGEAMGCGSHLNDLRRTEVTPFDGQEIYTLEALETLAESGEINNTLLPVDSAIPHYPRMDLDEEQAARICNGLRVAREDVPEAEGIRLYHPDGRFLGIGQKHSTGTLAGKRLMRTD
ncbi:tRNA pseudouridine(55) synthase TruB [Leucothrix sargassi]|nr:tRNA pseudouridine(55) synthase TruB [Leucothrix sargassi]